MYILYRIVDPSSCRSRKATKITRKATKGKKKKKRSKQTNNNSKSTTLFRSKWTLQTKCVGKRNVLCW